MNYSNVVFQSDVIQLRHQTVPVRKRILDSSYEGNQDNKQKQDQRRRQKTEIHQFFFPVYLFFHRESFPEKSVGNEKGTSSRMPPVS